MTVAEATKILAGPLTLGNEQQLRADKFLVQVEEAREARRLCRRNHGRYCECWESQERFSNDVIFALEG